MFEILYSNDPNQFGSKDFNQIKKLVESIIETMVLEHSLNINNTIGYTEEHTFIVNTKTYKKYDCTIELYNHHQISKNENSIYTNISLYSSVLQLELYNDSNLEFSMSANPKLRIEEYIKILEGMV